MNRKQHHVATSTVLALATATASLLLAGPVEAGPRHKVDTHGFGTWTAAAGGAALSGTATGAPFDGAFTAQLTADDGALPEPGVCEPATGTLRLEGSRDRVLELTATGSVCGQWLQPPNVVTQVFTGRYLVTASSQRRLVGTEGFYEIRLAVDGRASAFAIDT